jgi:hypothetical protein
MDLMGYNRGGARRTKRLKRQRKEQRRLAVKTAPAAQAKATGDAK